MAEFKQFLYTNTGTEIEFMQGFIDLLCGLGEGITCEDENGNPTTAAAQFADLTSSSTAKFYINFGTGYRLCILRNNNNSGVCKVYKFDNRDIQYEWGNDNVMTSTSRSFFVTYLKSDNFFAIWIGAYNINAITSTLYSAMRMVNDSHKYLGYLVGGYNIISATFSGNNTSVTFSPLFAYSMGAGKVDYIEHSPFISGGVKQFDCEDIFSCSTVPQFSSIALPNGKNYFAIGTNAMVEVDTEEEAS